MRCLQIVYWALILLNMIMKILLLWTRCDINKKLSRQFRGFHFLHSYTSFIVNFWSRVISHTSYSPYLTPPDALVSGMLKGSHILKNPVGNHWWITWKEWSNLASRACLKICVSNCTDKNLVTSTAWMSTVAIQANYKQYSTVRGTEYFYNLQGIF